MRRRRGERRERNRRDRGNREMDGTEGRFEEREDGTFIPRRGEAPSLGYVRTGKGRMEAGKRAPVFEGLAERKGYSQENTRLEKLKYSHEAMIDLIVANPRITQIELASKFGYSSPWVSRVMGSDAFQAALAKRREDITDPFLIATMEERLNGLAMQSLDIVAQKLADTNSADMALKALDLTTKAMGFGARDRSGGNTQNNFIVQIPGQARTAAEWAQAYSPSPTPAMKTVESKPMSTTATMDPLVQPNTMKIIEE